MRGAGRDDLVLEHRHDVGLRRLNRRRQAEEHAGQNGEGRREGEHPPVDASASSPDRQRQLQIGGDERVEQPVGEEQCRGAAAGHREQHALGERAAGPAAIVPAPSASRTAISLRRRVARASSRLAMFAHAISSTMPTTAMRMIERRTTGAPACPCGFNRASSERHARRRSVPCCRRGTPARARRRPSAG